MNDEYSKKIIAVIPARGGSKTVPRKNIRLLNNKPLITYSIEQALQSGVVDRIIVSSDDEEIISVAKENGAEAPFVRPAELAGDTVPDRPVLQHTVNWLAKYENYRTDFVIILRPTAPFRVKDDFKNLIDKWIKLGSDSVRSMTKVEGVHHPYWMYQSINEGMAQPLFKDIDILKNYYQRQLLPPLYRLNGIIDGITAETILYGSNLYGNAMGMIEIPQERSIDIDNQDDFEFAEFMMRKWAK